MLPKPESCKPCGWYGSGMGYVPDHVVEGSVLTILAQNPGLSEEKGERLIRYEGKEKVYEPCDPQPLIGPTGYALRHTYLPLTGIPEEQVSFCNLLKCRWTKGGKRTNDLPTGDLYSRAVAHCTATLLQIPPSTRLVVAMGKPAWEWTQGAGLSVTDWRGFVGPKVILCGL